VDLVAGRIEDHSEAAGEADFHRSRTDSHLPAAVAAGHSGLQRQVPGRSIHRAHNMVHFAPVYFAIDCSVVDWQSEAYSAGLQPFATLP
jgi:hypothetical protein